jgi:hypothetical protein
MDLGTLPQMIQAGGAVALACFVGYELRAFRTDLRDHLARMAEGIAVLLDRTERPVE